MNLIALRGFKNNAKDVIKVTPLSEEDGGHPDLVHKGARFTLGDEKSTLKDRATFENLPSKHAKMVSDLLTAGTIGDADDEQLCAKVDKEVVIESAHLKAHQAEAAGDTAKAASIRSDARKTAREQKEAETPTEYEVTVTDGVTGLSGSASGTVTVATAPASVGSASSAQ